MQLAIAIFNVPIIQMAFETKQNDNNNKQKQQIGFNK